MASIPQKRRGGAGGEVPENLSVDRTDALYRAIAKGDRAAVLSLLEKGVNVNETQGRSLGPPLSRAKAQLPPERGARAFVEDAGDQILLHVAAKRGYTEIVKMLLSSQADIHATNPSGETALHQATLKNKYETVQLLLKEGANIAAQDRRKRTPLHWAVEKGHFETVRLLLERSANTRTRGTDGRTPLHMAGEGGYHEIVQLLLHFGADATAEDDNGETAIFLAAKNCSERVVRLLIAHGINVNNKSGRGQSLLHCAYKGDSEKIAKLLLQNGADVNAKDRNEWTPLHIAASSDSEKIVDLLFRNGADVNAKDSLGWTPLHIAASGSAEKIVDLLLRNGADVNAKDGSEETPLYTAAIRGSEKIVDLLLRNGADVNAKDGDERTPLHIVGFGGAEKIVDLLLRNGADVNAKDGNERTPLHIAASGSAEKIVDLLLRNGADVNAKDGSEETPLHTAAIRGSEKMVDLLLRNGADVNAKDGDERTPLDIVGFRGAEKIVVLLLRNGADFDAKDGRERTPLHKAAVEVPEKIVKLLLRNGADVNARDWSGTTPLHMAEREDETRGRLLRGEGADVTTQIERLPNIAACESPTLATEAPSGDDWYDYEDILNPEKYFNELDHIERKVVRHSSLKYFEQGLYVVGKVRHSLECLRSDTGLQEVMRGLGEVDGQDHQDWKSHYEFTMYRLCESYSIILQALGNLDFLEESGVCGSFFTLLVATISRPEVAQVLRIERSTVEAIADSIRASIFDLATLSSRQKFDPQDCSQLPLALSSILEMPNRHCTELLEGTDLFIQGQLDEGSGLDMMLGLTTIRLAILILDLGLAMYSGSHGSDIVDCLVTDIRLGNESPTMEGLRTPPISGPRESLDELNPSRLQVLNEAATFGFQCSMKRLGCLEEFIEGSVWVFERLQIEPITTGSDRRLFVSTSIEDFSDMWGPVYAVPSKKDNLIKHYNVPKGMIRRVPLDTFSGLNVDECEIPCHWYSWAELSGHGGELPFAFDDLPIKPTDKLLIGLPFRENLTCHLLLGEMERTRDGRMVPAGTFSETWFTDAYQIGANAGFRGVGVSAQRTTKKRPRRTRKEAIWDKIKTSPQSFHPGIFDLWLGLEVSHCTGNARRIKMKDVFGLNPVISYLKGKQPDWYNSALGGQFLEAISSSDTGVLRKFWDSLSAEERLEVVGIVQIVIDPLQSTGVREDGDFGVGYLSLGRDAQIMLLNRRLNDWAGLMKDSETVAAYAVLNNVCLECTLQGHDTILCQTKGNRPGFTVLRTKITVPYGIPDHEESHCFRLGEQGRLSIISKKNDGVIVAKWEQAELRKLLDKCKKLVQPQKEILHDREVINDAEMGDRSFQVYIRSQHRSNFGWGEAVSGW